MGRRGEREIRGAFPGVYEFLAERGKKERKREKEKKSPPQYRIIILKYRRAICKQVRVIYNSTTEGLGTRDIPLETLCSISSAKYYSKIRGLYNCKISLCLYYIPMGS